MSQRTGLVALLGACLLAACVTLPARVAGELALDDADAPRFGSAPGAPATIELRAGAPQQERRFDPSALPLASGQIVVSETGDAMSLFFSLFTEDFAPWVHAGILAIEDGAPYVYDATGTVWPIPGVRPTAVVGGGVRRVALTRFMRGKRVVGFYAPAPEVDTAALVDFARMHHARGTPFDQYFDAGDASAFYCTEFVALGLQAAGAPAIVGARMRENASLVTALDWLQIRARRLILAGQLLRSAREVAIWSPDLSRAQVEAYFAAKRELQQRFGANARLGRLLRWTGFTLALRDEVRVFFADAFAVGAALESKGAAPLDVQRAVAALAESHLRRPPGGEAALVPAMGQ
ncbi:MAG TPA: hypothetical protein VEN28_09895 [Burkholderiaceae bacterium]|nr:hypothetical protein [Burkholderiaceae bacterium]